MKFNLIASISMSLLLARWKQTLVAAVGVTFIITMFITLLGFMSGLNDLLDGLILNRTPGWPFSRARRLAPLSEENGD